MEASKMVTSSFTHSGWRQGRITSEHDARPTDRFQLSGTAP